MINGNTLRDAIISGASNIANHRQQVDELNVFPVPDGDTGTNMSMSIGSAARELSGLSDKPAGQVAATAASALLRGARGNSGVILSLLFRGIGKVLKDTETFDGAVFAQALSKGVESAYKAVMKPTEGTILTVSRAAAEQAGAASQANADFLPVFRAALEGARQALAQTPELLPVLKKAGVVDAGGKGLVIIFEGMLSVFETGKVIEPAEKSEPTPAASRNAAGASQADITFTYCTEFLVRRAEKNDAHPKALRAYLETIGDCVVVVDDEEIIKVHVHTDHPGNAIEKALTFGQLVNLKIENMRDQHERAKHDAGGSPPAQAAPNADGGAWEPAAPEKPYGFVAVSVGEGLQALFKDLGVDRIVSGGQTMNPSTDDILRAIEQTPAETVFVLPNNKNIIMAAEQAIPLSSRNVVVLPTRTIPMGVAALLAFDEEASTDDNAIAMRAAYDKVSTGQITFAARDSTFDGHKIKKGELLALENGKIIFTESDLIKCASKLTKQMVRRDSAFITLIYGADVSDAQAQAVEQAVRARVSSDIEITLINGGQPVYYFIISVE